MNPKPILAILAALALVSCAGVADTVLTYKGKATEQVLESTKEAVKLYCATTPEAERMANRVKMDEGKGPILEAHCERL